jgi:hypothetical protein
MFVEQNSHGQNRSSVIFREVVMESMRLSAFSVLVVFCVVLFVIPSHVSATAQFPDRMTYKDEILPVYSNPLESYFSPAHPRPNDLFPPASTACWRGYTATWKIENEHLYLIKVETCMSQPREISLSDIFPDRSAPILADWFSGLVRIPRGKMLHYVHMGYDSTYERELFLTFEKGKLIAQEEVDNTRAKFPSKEQRVIE